jgi:hypothetical protein
LINDGENLDSLMKRAVLTRWWYVTCAMGNLIKNWDAWLKVATQLVNLEGGSKKAGKVASSLFSLMQKPVLKCHALFVVAFSTSFFHKHYEWMQRSDDIAKVNGYRARSTAEHFFITITELDEMAASWETMEAFKDFFAAKWENYQPDHRLRPKEKQLHLMVLVSDGSWSRLKVGKTWMILMYSLEVL